MLNNTQYAHLEVTQTIPVTTCLQNKLISTDLEDKDRTCKFWYCIRHYSISERC